MRALRRDPHRGPLLQRIVTGHDAAAFDRMGTAAVLLKRKRELVGGLRERTLAVAVGNGVFGQDVARHAPVHRRRVGRNRGAQVRHRRQRFECDLHALRCILRGRAALRNHHRDWIADVADLVPYQHERGDVLAQATARESDDLTYRLAERRSLGTQVRHQVVEREDRVHSGRRTGCSRVDAVDGGMRVR